MKINATNAAENLREITRLKFAQQVLNDAKCQKTYKDIQESANKAYEYNKERLEPQHLLDLLV